MRRWQQRGWRAHSGRPSQRGHFRARLSAALGGGLVALSLLLGACGPSGSSSGAPRAVERPAAPTAAAPASPTAPPLRHVRINIPALSATSIQYYLARDEGLFARRGIDAEISVISAALGIKAVIAGDFEFTGAVGTTVSAALTDVPVRVVAINVDRPLSWLYAQPSIASLAELKGKTVAVSAPGALDDANSRLVLRAAGIDTDRDLIFINIGTPDQRVGPLLAGAVDAAVLALPGNVLARQAGMTELAFYGERFRSPFAGLTTSTQIIQERRDLVKNTVAALMDAVDFYNTHPMEAKASLREVLEIEPALVDGVYDSVKLGWTTDGTMSTEAMQDNIRALAPAAGADPNTDPGAVFDFSVVHEILAGR